MEAAPSLPRKSFLEPLSRSSDAIFAAGILGTLVVLIIPLPTPLMDSLLLVNLTGSLLILMTAASTRRPLELSAFPSLLLVATFFRLALNVATTRLILGNADQRGLAAAGGVVEAFAKFVAGTNLGVGMVIFVIIVVVQFVVITKGTTRISEVAARFTLDAMPGKQLSIDGDLAAGFISDDEARRRRKEMSDEASFYGAMDGASKFVRGEAVAGIFITLTNILGGFFLGTLYHGMDVPRAASLFTRLTLGDGLVTQIPALMVSVATAFLVTRGAGTESLGRELGRQLFVSDRVFFSTAAFLLVLLPSGLPRLGLVAGAAACTATGLLLRRQARREETGAADAPASARSRAEGPEEQARALLALEPIELEIGFRLIGLVDEERGGDLMTRLAKARDRVALDLGLVVPPIKVMDNTRLHPTEYSIKLRGNGIGRWRVKPGRYLVSTDGASIEGIQGAPGTDPVTGRPGLWIEESQGPSAASAGLRLRKVPEIIADHLDRVIRLHAADVLTREEASRLISDLKKRAPALVDELIPGTLKIGEVHKVLQGLLRDQVSIRDLETILETLADHGDRTRDTKELTEHARHALARTICGSVAGRDGSIRALLLDPALEEFLQGSIEKGDRGFRLAIEPEVAEALVESIANGMGRFEPSRQPPVLVCSGMIRAHVRSLASGRVPQLFVLAYEEITDDFRLEQLGTVAFDREMSGAGREAKVNRE